MHGEPQNVELSEIQGLGKGGLLDSGRYDLWSKYSRYVRVGKRVVLGVTEIKELRFELQPYTGLLDLAHTNSANNDGFWGFGDGSRHLGEDGKVARAIQRTRTEED